MPIYQNKACLGACERLGYPCKAQEWYVERAEEFGCKPIQVPFQYGDGPDDTLLEWVLDMPDGMYEDARDCLGRELVKDPDEDASFWLQEFPCHSGCEWIICGFCGQQHLEMYAHDWGCELDDRLNEIPYGELE